ncbi:MAG TPA: AraC family transcriptional regulator ligand-binding domain-containing protein, partial [Polyangiaceae bacterium]|nr:AraC family transcriptional regulator ligand-binding domain-containing protein [Polyangiaceae bacterium]
MTQRANDLPLPASSGSPSSGPPGSGPFVLAATVSAPFELALSAGVDRRVLLARAGLNEGDLDEPDALVPRDAQTAIWEVVGELPEAETIALDLAERSELGAMGVVGWAMTHAPNGRAVVDSIRRYARLFGDPYIPLIEHDADRTVIHREFEPRIVATRVLPEYAPASTVVLLRRSLGLEADEPLALEVWFQHSPPRDDSRHRALFACPIRFGAPETRLVLSGAALERPIEGRDPNLYAYLDRHALSLARGVPQTSTLAARVS